MKKKKLELKKKVIATLSDVQKAKIMGGDDAAAYTTSFTNCTHFICCGDTCSVNPTNCDDTCNVSCDKGPCDTDPDICRTQLRTHCGEQTCWC